LRRKPCPSSPNSPGNQEKQFDFESTTRWEALNAESYQSFGDNQTLGGSASELGEQLAASSGVR
jgi:hypothetical protein